MLEIIIGSAAIVFIVACCATLLFLFINRPIAKIAGAVALGCLVVIVGGSLLVEEPKPSPLPPPPHPHIELLIDVSSIT